MQKRITSILMLFLFLFCLSTTTEASYKRFTFRNYHLNESIPEDVFTKGSCLPSGGSRICYNLTYRLGGESVKAYYTITDGKFTNFSLNFKPEQYQFLLAVMTKKLGKPDKMGKEIIQNRMGATFQNEFATWKTPDGVAILEKYSGKITMGDFHIMSEKDVQKSARERKKNITEAADDL